MYLNTRRLTVKRGEEQKEYTDFQMIIISHQCVCARPATECAEGWQAVKNAQKQPKRQLKQKKSNFFRGIQKIDDLPAKDTENK